MAEELSRHEIDEIIFEKSQAVPTDNDDWYLSPEYKEFVNSWDLLTSYYRRTGEFMFSASTVSEFHAFVWMFLKLLFYEKDPEKREEIEDAAGYLMYTLNEVLMDAMPNWDEHYNPIDKTQPGQTKGDSNE